MPSYTTQKSFKTQIRDKPKHSNKDVHTAKKGGAGGRGTWGAEKDDVKFMDEDGHAFDVNDPNYDPVDQTEGDFSVKDISEPTRNPFNGNTMSDFPKYKELVRDALVEYLVSHELNEFLLCVKDPKFNLFHQDLPSILIKFALDKSGEERIKISNLLRALHKENIVTSKQMAQGFRKLYNVLDELIVDAPKAQVILAEFVGHGHAGGYLDGKDMAEMEQEALMLADFPALKGTKAKIASIVNEYLASGELHEMQTGMGRIPRAMQFEVVKQLVLLAMDHADSHRELTSRALAALLGDAIHTEQGIKGFTVLLHRAEDLILDVPDSAGLLAKFVARAISDEALPPSFLLRLDLAQEDKGYHVALQARSLLDQPHAAEVLATVWGARPDEEEE